MLESAPSFLLFASFDYNTMLFLNDYTSKYLDSYLL